MGSFLLIVWLGPFCLQEQQSRMLLKYITMPLFIRIMEDSHSHHHHSRWNNRLQGRTYNTLWKMLWIIQPTGWKTQIRKGTSQSLIPFLRRLRICLQRITHAHLFITNLKMQGCLSRPSAKPLLTSLYRNVATTPPPLLCL